MLPPKRKRQRFGMGFGCTCCVEGVPISQEGGPPAWLMAQFPDHHWISWRTCCVRVDGEMGAGLDLEATPSGYRVEAVEGAPQQAEELRPGALIVTVDGFPLFGLDEEALEKAFGSRFKDGASLELLDWEELCDAEAERDAADDAELEELQAVGAAAATLAEEVSESGQFLRRPLGAGVVRTLAPGDRERLEGDLRELGRKTDAVAELLCPAGAAMDSVVLRGKPEAVRAAKRQLFRILAFHGVYGVPLPELSVPQGL